MSIGQKIVDLREQRGWTRYRLWKESKVSYSYLMALESGQSDNPTRDVIEKLAKALGVTVAELLDGLSDVANKSSAAI